MPEELKAGVSQEEAVAEGKAEAANANANANANADANAETEAEESVDAASPSGEVKQDVKAAEAAHEEAGDDESESSDVSGYRRALRKKNSENASLRARVRQLEAEAKASRVQLLRAEVASEMKLSAEAAEFLAGETREEIQESGEKLRRMMGLSPITPPKTGDSGGAGEKAESASAELDRLAAEMYRR